MRIDTPDKVAKYDHVHLYNEKGEPLDINGNVVDYKSRDAQGRRNQWSEGRRGYNGNR